MQISLKELFKGLIDCKPDIKITGITSNSRFVRKGFLFCSLSDNADLYIKDSISNGAVAVLCSDKNNLQIQNATFITCKEPKDLHHKICKKLYPDQPKNLCAVTGTNGKTSVCNFFGQICTLNNKKSASIGTLGLVIKDTLIDDLKLTCPDSLDLYKSLSYLKGQGVEYAALEASSHGLLQKRMHSAKLQAAAFTNLSHDHLDYHKDIDSYFDAKKKLFTQILQKNGAAVINTECEFGKKLATSIELKKIIMCGRKNCDIKIINQTSKNWGQIATIKVFDKILNLELRLFGRFQLENLLIAIGLANFYGLDVFSIDYKIVKSVPGRMEQVLNDACGKKVFVDFAHTPDALKLALLELRWHFGQKKIIVVFGCGGDRDKAKRPLMGKIASRYADKIIVCDDNPRNEDPKKIRREIIKECKNATEIAGRKEAIKHALYNSCDNNIVLIAGRGHEKIQKFANSEVKMNDADFVRSLI